MTPFQRNNAGFPSGTDLLYYMEMLALNNLKTNAERKISCVKNLIFVRMKHFGCNTRFVTCKPPGSQTKHLIPTTRGRLNPLDRIFPTWEIEGSSLPDPSPSSQKSPH